MSAGRPSAEYRRKLDRLTGREPGLLADPRARREAVLLSVVVVVVFALWDTVFVYPLKILTVLFHEMSHALAALLTGGEVLAIHLTSQQGGACLTRGGNAFLVTSAGYVGSMLFGAALILASARSRAHRGLVRALGLVVLLVTVSVVGLKSPFAFVFGLLAGAALLAAGWKLSEHACELILKVVGVTSCLYALFDIRDDVLLRPGIGSDADRLAAMTGVPTLVWGVLWIGLAGWVAVWTIRVALRSERRRAPSFGYR